jgi:hypothetical protein
MQLGDFGCLIDSDDENAQAHVGTPGFMAPVSLGDLCTGV